MFTLLNPFSENPILLLCEHAENKIPAELGDLGLSDLSILDGHRGFDPPMKRITELLADKIGATAIMGNYTRLCIDLNRRLNDPDLIPEHYFGYNVEANVGLNEEERSERIAIYYAPYHAQISFHIRRLKRAGITPFILSLHSFSESPGENMPLRPWDIGLLYNQYDAAAHHFDDFLTRNHPEFLIGHNEPYDLRVTKTSSVITHGEENDLPHLLIELKNEAFERGEQTHEQWVSIIAAAIKDLM